MKDLAGLGLPQPAAALALACRRDAAAVAAVGALPAFRTESFQTAFRHLAERHGVWGLVLSSLERSGVMPEEYLGVLKLLRRQAAIWDLERDFVLELLRARGISVVLLKGSALRLSAYRDPVERAFVDLDLLVPETEVDLAIQTLADVGYQSQSDWRARLYREHHHHIVLQKEMGFMVEVHWALEPKRSPFRLDPSAFRQAAVTRPTSTGHAVQVPRPEHHILHLATQNLEDGFCRLNRIVDVDRIVSQSGDDLQWNLLNEDAVRMRVNIAVALSLRLAQLLLGTEVPADVYHGLKVPWLCRLHLGLLDPASHLLEQRVLRRASLERLIFLWSIPDAADRRQALRATFRGEQDWFAELGFLQSAAPGRVPRRRRVIPMLKLLAAQAWLYATSTARTVSGRRRRFWPR